MPQFPNNYSAIFQQPSTFSPSSNWSESVLKGLQGKFVGMDTSTGKRDVDLATGQQITPFIGFTPVPKVSESGELSPTDLSVDYYKKLQEALAPGVLKSQAQQGLVNLAGAGAFGLMSLPFTEYMKNQELARQQEAFRMREQSPTAQSARDLSFQQQASLASQASADKMRAYGELKRNLIEPLRNR